MLRRQREVTIRIIAPQRDLVVIEPDSETNDGYVEPVDIYLLLKRN